MIGSAIESGGSIGDVHARGRRAARWVPRWHFGLPVTLSILGLLFLYSTTYTGWFPSRTVLFQVLWLVIAVALYHFLSRINLGVRPSSSVLLFWPIEILLIATLLIGWAVHGSSRWLKVGPLTIQPSEFAKFFAILLLAYFFSACVRSEEHRRFWWALLVLIAMIIPILRQPDLGTAMVFVLVFLSIIYVKPLPWRYLVGIIIALVIVAVPGWFMLKDYQRARIVSFFQPSRDPLGSGYHVSQSKIAIGSGGMWGKGFRAGTQTQGQFIPVQAADFIFATIGEEWGFIGVVIVFVLFGYLFILIYTLARKVQSDYQRLVVFGVLATLFFQLFINVGMTVGLTPVTGLPLPFLSYGGSSMLTMWALMALLASIERHLPTRTP